MHIYPMCSMPKRCIPVSQGTDGVQMISRAQKGLCLLLQVFTVKPDSLQPTTYYLGVFNMDYYIHQPYSYTLRVRRSLAQSSSLC